MISPTGSGGRDGAGAESIGHSGGGCEGGMGHASGEGQVGADEGWASSLRGGHKCGLLLLDDLRLK